MNYALDEKKRVEVAKKVEAARKDVFWSKKRKYRDQMTTMTVSWILICRRFWLNYRQDRLL